ncbi:MAG: PEP-CTERM sorting domain-containing protein [Pacificimonas sp.]
MIRSFIPAVLLLGMAAPAMAVTVSQTDDDFATVDGGFDFKDFTFDASEFGDEQAITGVTLQVVFDKCVNTVSADGCGDPGGGTIPFNNEIGFALIAPDGTIVSLIENDGGNEDFETGATSTFGIGSGDFENISILFSDGGAALGADPVSGTFAPEGALSDFAGVLASGTWRFFFEDDAGADPLGIRSVTLSLTTAGAIDVPAPAALGLFGLGLAGLAGWRRRKAG